MRVKRVEESRTKFPRAVVPPCIGRGALPGGGGATRGVRDSRRVAGNVRRGPPGWTEGRAGRCGSAIAARQDGRTVRNGNPRSQRLRRVTPPRSLSHRRPLVKTEKQLPMQSIPPPRHTVPRICQQPLRKFFSFAYASTPVRGACIYVLSRS